MLLGYGFGLRCLVPNRPYGRLDHLVASGQFRQ